MSNPWWNKQDVEESAENWNRSMIRGLVWIVIIGAAIGLLLSGCSVRQQTVTAPPIHATQASFSGNHQDSGIIDCDERGCLVRQDWIDRYDAFLTANFKRPQYVKNEDGEKVLNPRKIIPAPYPGDREGITPEGDNFRVTGQIMARFLKLNRAYKEGR